MDYRHWYALFVMTGNEDVIGRRIESEAAKRKNVSVSAFVPKVLQYEIHSGVKIPIYKVMFPGYVLVGTDDIAAVSAIVASCKGVIRFLRDGEAEFQ
jgi:transcriptional antiterminator NusG